ncbi:hypothetical protein KC717_04720 [Candidatus Dojkabacteria bacterium]|uniref:S-layer family duplication domain-containing protein n=1 Tax=Candidatus Dojkabacteria bacterium TaxID=2099670 RepID=A0A955L9C0_9BACT|nr:hypothetical protein [Candidatus Dojkabacteria bacterium]
MKNCHIQKILRFTCAIILFAGIFTQNSNYRAFGQTNSLDLSTQMYSTGEELTNPYVPFNIFISNVAATSFTVNWLTSAPSEGSVIWGSDPENLTKQTLDIRDKTGTQELRFTHSVLISDSSLSQSNPLYFKIISDDLLISNSGESFSYFPPEALSSPPSPTSQDGTIVDENNTVVEGDDYLIIGQLGVDSLWVTTTLQKDNSGNWNLPIGGILMKNFETYAEISEPLLLQVFGNNNSFGTASVLASEDVINVMVLEDIPSTITTTPTPIIEPTSSPEEIPPSESSNFEYIVIGILGLGSLINILLILKTTRK